MWTITQKCNILDMKTGKPILKTGHNLHIQSFDTYWKALLYKWWHYDMCVDPAWQGTFRWEIKEKDKDMKTRRGFVSNSSTTSFCIYGARTSVSEDNWEGEGYLWDKLNELGITMEYSEWDGRYLGASWDSIRGEETRNQFCERVKAAILEIDPNADEFGTYEEAYRDG